MRIQRSLGPNPGQNNDIHSKGRAPAIVLLLALLLAFLPGAAPAQVSQVKLHPMLVTLATNPSDQMVPVIVQGQQSFDDLVNAIDSTGSTLTGDLHFINAVSALVPAGALQTIARSPAVKWISPDGPMVNAALSATNAPQTVRDEFGAVSFSNNNGTKAWNGGWVESEPLSTGAGPLAGHVRIDLNQLSLEDYPDTGGKPGAARRVDLSQAQNATLSFDFATTWGVDWEDAVAVEVSVDGVNFTRLDTFTGIIGSSSGTRSYDISGFRSANTTIRFFVASMYGASFEQFFIDNVQVTFTEEVTTVPPPPTQGAVSGTIRDDFSRESYRNNDGSRIWTSRWQEVMDDDSPIDGRIIVDDSGYLEFKMDGTFGKSIVRSVNLAGAGSAQLRYYIRKDTNLKDNQAVKVEVSTDDKSTWVALATITASTPKDKLHTVDMLPLLGSLTENTAIRFRQSAGSGGEKLQLDYVEIAFTNADPQIDTVFVTWSSALGTKENAEWFDVQNVIEPNGYGPDGLYGYTSDEKASFAGFHADMTPRHAIGKVELILPVYARRQVTGKEVKITVYLDGSKLNEIKLPSTIFNNYVGIANAGTVAVNLTNSHDWQWLDFANNLEIVIEQRDFKDDENQFVHYDGVGLRVTSMAGVDNSMDTLLFDGNLPKAAFETSNLVQAFPFAVRAPEVWNQSPAFLQGQDVTVAVVDSGASKIRDIKSRLIANVNFSQGYRDGNDKYGHGTFVATILGGDGTSSEGKYTGVAPKVDIANVRVSDDKGRSTEGDVLQSLQWVFENAEEENIRVVNLSLNAAVAQSYHTSPLAAGVEMLWLRGIVVVVSAGNNGSADLYPPANSPRVITVGATDDKGTPGIADDEIAHFSAWGTDELGNGKPDLVAPGTNIVAFVPDNGKLTIGKNHKENAVDKNYFRMSGTSMATPIVAGAVAMLLQDEPNLTPDQVKFRLKATANQNWAGYDPARAGAGYLDVYAAVQGTSTDYANQGLPPSELLRPFIMQMVDAGVFGDTGFDWNSVNWNSVNWNSVNWNSVNWNSVNWNSVNWNSVNWNSVNWNSVNWNSVNWNSDHWDGSYEMTQSVRDRTMQPIPLLVDGEEGVESSNMLFLPNVTAGGSATGAGDEVERSVNWNR